VESSGGFVVKILVRRALLAAATLVSLVLTLGAPTRWW